MTSGLKNDENDVVIHTLIPIKTLPLSMQDPSSLSYPEFPKPFPGTQSIWQPTYRIPCPHMFIHLFTSKAIQCSQYTQQYFVRGRRKQEGTLTIPRHTQEQYAKLHTDNHLSSETNWGPRSYKAAILPDALLLTYRKSSCLSIYCTVSLQLLQLRNMVTICLSSISISAQTKFFQTSQLEGKRIK